MSKGNKITTNDFGVKIDFTVAFDTIESANVFLKKLKGETIIAFAMWSLKQVAYNQAERLGLVNLVPDALVSPALTTESELKEDKGNDSQPSGNTEVKRNGKSE